VFERLLYTDCRAGQGRGGGAGFQIQAQSPGVTPALSRLAVDTLLYASQAQWLTSGRAVEDFPLGLAHSSKDGWGTAQSRYLGQEVTGNRAGNHLADCLLTTDAELYGAIRPAQLLESQVWRDTPFDTVDCPPFDGFLQPGPLTNDDIQEWLQADARRRDVLKRLVSILGDSRGPNVLILADTTEDAVRWIAAATILPPIRAALETSFKVFVNNVNQASQRIIAVPKELNPTIKPDAAGSRFVIDATDSSSGAFESTKRATYWVDRLLSAEDAYDVVEAVDLAEALAGHDPSLAAEAHQTAWAIIAEGETLTNPSPLIRWLTMPKDPSLAEHESAAASRLIDSGLTDASTLNWMERQADAGRLEVDRAALRRALMRSEIAEAPTALSVRPEELSPVDVGDGLRRDAESAISSALLLATDGSLVDRLLRTAKRHSVPLTLAPLQDRLRSFIADWIANPALSYDPGLWALSENLIQELAAQLGSQTEFTHGYSRVRPLLAQVWPYLLQRVRDPNSPLTWELHAASIATASEKSKMRQLESVIKGLSTSEDANEAIAGFQRALVAWRAVSGREAMLFADTLPPRSWPASEFADLLWTTVRSEARRPDKLVLDTVWRLADWRRLPSSAVTDKLHRSDRHVARFLTEASEIRSAHDLERLRELRKVDPDVVRIRQPDFVEVSLESPVPILGAAILRRLPTDRQRDFLQAWGQALLGEDSALAAARGYVWSEDQECDLRGWHREYIGTLFAQHAAALGAPEQAAWIQSVERLLEPGERAGFQDFVSDRHRSLRQKLKPSFHGASDGPSKRPRRNLSKED
jgi:hypothetical protein